MEKYSTEDNQRALRKYCILAITLALTASGLFGLFLALLLGR